MTMRSAAFLKPQRLFQANVVELLELQHGFRNKTFIYKFMLCLNLKELFTSVFRLDLLYFK